jgi:PKD domain
MRRHSFTARRTILTIVATFVASLVVTVSGAQALVVNDAGTEAGVSLVPSSRDNPLPSGVTAVTSSSSCTDPWLAADLGGPAMPNVGLCYRGGGVMHKNETFALTWDQQRAYWSQTRGYVEQFLRDVADASGSLGSPFAVTSQYNDGGGRAQNASLFGGGCIDYGTVGGSACEFGSPTGAGHDFPANGCNPAGDSFVSVGAVTGNPVCLTDAQLQGEVSTMVAQTGIVGRTRPGYTPLVTLLLPPGVETCLDSGHLLCSTNAHLTPPPPVVSTLATGGTIAAGTYGVEVTYTTSGGESVASSAQTITTTGGTSTITIESPPVGPGVTGWYAYVTQPNGYTYMRQGTSANAIGSSFMLTQPPAGGPIPPNPAAFCSYHSQVNVGGTDVAYVVQPWTAGTGCDEPGLPNIPDDPSPQQLSVAVGARLVSPLSQAHIGAIVNPGLNGWAALDGSEIMDNHVCTPLPRTLDSVTVGSSSQNPYFLQREFNNAAALEFDPVTYFGCAPVVNLVPAFVAPSAVDQGDEIQLDGSTTASTLIVPNHGYAWSFGDGTTATGPSVVHSYTKGGTYTITLTVTDRGENVASTTQTVTVLGSNDQPVTPPTQSPGGPSPGSHGGQLIVHLQLVPQSLKNVLANGINIHLTSNQAADGIAKVSIPRKAAKRARISPGRGPSVQIGVGTVQIKGGRGTLRVHLSKATAAKLRKLGHVTLTIRLALVAKGGSHLTIVEAGRY